MLNVRGLTLFPSAVEDVVRGFAELGEEFEIVLTNEDGLDELTLVVEPIGGLAGVDHVELCDRLEGRFRAALELRPKIEIRPYGSLPKTEFKAKRVRDLRDG